MQPNSSNQMQKETKSTAKRLILLIVRLNLLALSFFTSESIYAQQIQVGRISYAGLGCNAGTVAVVMSPDNTAFSLLFDDFGVESDVRSPQQQKNCRVEIDLNIPKGFQLELPYVDYRGYAFAADSNSYAILKSHHYFSGGAVDLGNGRRVPGGTFAGGFTQSMAGPFDDSFTFRAEVPGFSRREAFNEKFKDSKGKGLFGRMLKKMANKPMERNISRCDGIAKLRVDTRVIATVARTEGSHALLHLDSADGAFVQQFGLALLPCDKDNKRVTEMCRKNKCPETP